MEHAQYDIFLLIPGTTVGTYDDAHMTCNIFVVYN